MKTFLGMLVVAVTIIVFSLMPATGGVQVGGTGNWQALGNGNYIWRDHTGRSDGVLYAWHLGGGHYGHGQYYSKAVRSLTPEEVQQVNGPVDDAQQQQQQEQQAATQTQNQAQYVYGNGQGAPEVGWRARGLQIIASQVEQQHFDSFLNRLLPGQTGSQGGTYDAKSPYQAKQGYGSVEASQYGGGSGSAVNVLLGDLPQQQGNSVYGSLDPTFNTFADPLRTFDFGAVANQLMQMDAQREAGGVRLGTETRQTLQAMIEAARMMKEVETHWNGKMNVLRLLKDIEPRPSTSQTVRIETNAQGQASVKVLQNGPGVPPSATPPSGPPGTHPGQDGGSGPPVASGGNSADDQLFMGLVSSKCLRCHGTDKPAGNLKLGKGTLVDFTAVNETQAKAVFDRVRAGSMPPGEPLSAEEKAVFDRMESKLMPAGGQ